MSLLLSMRNEEREFALGAPPSSLLALRRPGAGLAPRPLQLLILVVMKADNLRGVASQPKNVQSCVCAVDDVDEPAVVGRDVVRLDHLPANVRDALERAAPEIRVGGGGRDEERHVLWVVRIADVEGAHAGVLH